MWNEHSVCEREIEELKEEVEYYKKLHQNEYEARQRLIKELQDKNINSFINCCKCNVLCKPLSISETNNSGKFVCPECYRKITIHAPIGVIKLFT